MALYDWRGCQSSDWAVDRRGWRVDQWSESIGRWWNCRRIYRRVHKVRRWGSVIKVNIVENSSWMLAFDLLDEIQGYLLGQGLFVIQSRHGCCDIDCLLKSQPSWPNPSFMWSGLLREEKERMPRRRICFVLYPEGNVISRAAYVSPRGSAAASRFQLVFLIIANCS